jgi:hypothetical protein
VTYEDPQTVTARLSPASLVEITSAATAFYDALTERRYDEAQTHLDALGRAIGNSRTSVPQGVERAQEALQEFLDGPDGDAPEWMRKRSWKGK